MSLILSLANSRFTIQLSDGRLTQARAMGKQRYVITEEARKCGSVVCGDARMAYSFAGLAQELPGRKFDTRNWLMRAILKAAPPDCSFEFLVQRLRAIATTEFAENPNILRLPKFDRRLSVMFSGFWNTNRGLVPAGWVVTNFQQNFDIDPGGTHDSTEPWDEFKVYRWHAGPENANSFVHIERLGAWRSVMPVEMARLEDLLRDNRPADAVIGRALKVLRSASDSDASLGTVGKQVNVMVIPSDITEEIRYIWESNVVTDDIFVPDSLIAKSPDFCRWVTLDLRKARTSDSPFAASVPRVHRKATCPCGSGKIYQNCHRRYRRDIYAKGHRDIFVKVSPNLA